MSTSLLIANILAHTGVKNKKEAGNHMSLKLKNASSVAEVGDWPVSCLN